MPTTDKTSATTFSSNSWLVYLGDRLVRDTAMAQNELEIDLDDNIIDELLGACRRKGKEDNFKGCIDCKLRFMCWTHKRMEIDEEIEA